MGGHQQSFGFVTYLSDHAASKADDMLEPCQTKKMIFNATPCRSVDDRATGGIGPLEGDQFSNETGPLGN